MPHARPARSLGRFVTRVTLLAFSALSPVGGPATAQAGPSPSPDVVATPAPRPSEVLAKAAAAGSGVTAYLRDEIGQAPARRAEAPRLVVANAEGKTELVPLKETSAEIQIAGAVAAVRVHQVFENTGTKPIEALYVFPASARAAVHAMRMTIGARTIQAKLDRKAQARATFEQARAQGQRASLLEEERPNVFTMRVTNIMPKDRIDVSLDYSEMLVPEDGTYELVYPTVVGPRYQGGPDPQDRGWMSSPTTGNGVSPLYEFALKAHLETGVPLKELSSPSHPIAASPVGTTHADVTMTDPAGGNRDFVLRYRLAGDHIETGALLSPADGRDGGAGTFAIIMEPPRAPKLAELPPREYLFLLDVSGSMHGFPLDTAKELMRQLLPKLRPTDAFDVALFSGSAYVMSPTGSVPATRQNVAHALEVIEQQQGGGGTELMGGLEMTYRIPRRDVGVSRTVVVVTDGFVGVEAQAFRFVREHLGDANLFAFGIGSSVNRHLIEGLARAGMGEPFVVLGTAEAAAQAERLRKTIEEPVLTHIAVSFKGFDTRETSPSAAPDLLARRPLVILGQYTGAPQGTVTITGLAGGHTPFRQDIVIGPANVSPAHAPLRALWARRWVALMEDELALNANATLEEGITSMGLHYQLLTPFTSFVAVDSEIVNRGGGLKGVTQPLPLPEGVDEHALGSESADVLGGLTPALPRQGLYGLRSAPSAASAPAATTGAGHLFLKKSSDAKAEGAVTLGSGRPQGNQVVAHSAPKEWEPGQKGLVADERGAAKPSSGATNPPPPAPPHKAYAVTIASEGKGPLSPAVRHALEGQLAAALEKGVCMVARSYDLVLRFDETGHLVDVKGAVPGAVVACIKHALKGVIVTDASGPKTLKVRITVS